MGEEDNYQREVEHLKQKGYSEEQIKRIEADLHELADIIFSIYRRKQLSSYQDLKKITDEVYAALPKRIKYGSRVIKLLADLGIKLRDKDGALHSVNISIPTSLQDSILIGMRYIKKDGTLTEDGFLFTEGRSVRKCYKRDLERLLPEYDGTHKDQLRNVEESQGSSGL